MRGSIAIWAASMAMLAVAGSAAATPLREVISLDGSWQVEEGPRETAPTTFGHSVVVPGLMDMAQPAFEEVGVKSELREAFWYRRTFRFDGPAIPAVASLKVHKAMFGSAVILNGTKLGDHQQSFTPGYFDAHDALKVGENELLIRVGAFRDAVPAPIPSGGDYEKRRFIPGIFDTVELITSGSPFIARVQAVPELDEKAVTVHAWLRDTNKPAEEKLFLTVREKTSGRVVGEETLNIPVDDPSQAERTGRTTIPIRDCRLWSPEDPFLYELEVRGSADTMQTRFGMRSFRLDPDTGRAILNGRPYSLRGSNVTLYRFFEDAERGDKPWREEWVRRLHGAFRDMHWNSLRYCIGFPPEMWYRVADEMGVMIQDEFPIWNMQPKPGELDADELAQEYTEWMQERWNHPSVVIWDSCNETISPETGNAIQKVRGLDYSNRPFDNGWSQPVEPGDSRELHPYHFSNSNYRLANIADDPGTLGWKPGSNAIINNEYGWLWLNRDGTPTTLTRDVYRNLLGPDSTTAQRRHLYARYMAAETEFWRSHRACAGVLHFCGLGYSRSDGQTSDHWIDLEKLTWEPEFATYVRDAFAPVGIMLDAWAEEYPAGAGRDFPVVVINDLDKAWKGSVRFRLSRGDTVLQEKTAPCEVAALGDRKMRFRIDVPSALGSYQLEAALIQRDTPPVRSLRDFEVISDEQRQKREGLSLNKPVKASSVVNRDGQTYEAAFAVDGKPGTRWSSEFSDPQWIAVDLGQSRRIARIGLDWENAHAKSYVIEVSTDGNTWREVYRTTDSKGGAEQIRFTPVEARWVRLTGTERATEYGYSLWEFRIFPE